jgi:hypothetical protein
MTKDREFKDRVRARMDKTGGSYATARARLDRRAGLPPVRKVVPVLRVPSWPDVEEHYVDALGFEVRWIWRAAPGSPAIVAIERDRLELMLSEDAAAGAVGGTWITVSVVDLDALVAEWNERREGSAAVVVGPPYDIPTCTTIDLCGNRIDWQEPVSKKEDDERRVRGEAMRRLVAGRVAAGEALPTADELVALVGPPIGLALAVLLEAQTSVGGAENP